MYSEDLECLCSIAGAVFSPWPCTAPPNEAAALPHPLTENGGYFSVFVSRVQHVSDMFVCPYIEEALYLLFCPE